MGLRLQAVIYGDLKPSNLLLDENGRLKLGGFGLSKRLADINACALQPGVHVIHASEPSHRLS